MYDDQQPLAKPFSTAENPEFCTESQKADTVSPSISGPAVPLESVLCTEELLRRPPRPPDYEKENCALVALAQALADSPRTILQTLADTILEVCDVDSAGISLLDTQEGGKRFFWPAVAGRWRPQIGGGTPRDFGPCGDVLDRNMPLLFRHPESRYTYLQPATPPVEEGLLVPFYVDGKAVGTIWAIAHNDRRKFDAEDKRLMSSLGIFASSAYQVVTSLDAIKFQVAEREKAESDLRRSDARLRNLIETAPIGLNWIGADGTILWANKAETDLLGYAPEEYIGHHIAEFYAAESALSDSLGRLSRGETLQDYEAPLRCKDGATRHVLIDSSALFENGRFVHNCCFTRDITQRKKAEAELRNSERRFRELIDALPAAVYTTDAEGRVTHFNPAAVELSGRVPELGNDRWHVCRKLFRADGTPLPLDECGMAVTINTGRIVNWPEVIAERPDGKRVHFKPHPRLLRDTEGRIVGGINMLVDITEFKRAEEKVRQRTAQFEILFNAAPLGIYMIDGDFRIRAINPTALATFDLPNAIGRDFDELLQALSPKTHADEVAKRFRHTLETGEPYIVSEWIGERLDRAVHNVYDWQIHRIPLFDGRNGVVCYFRDVTDQMRARDELRESEERLRMLAGSLEMQVQARTYELEQRNTEVQKQAGELRQLSQQLMYAQDEEKRRLARELHDSAGQMLASLGMDLAVIAQHAKLSPPELVSATADGQRLVRQLSQEIRTVSYLLHPPLLDETGLPEALRLYLKGLQERSGLDISLSIPKDFGRLSRDMELAIFRIVQECLTNVHRHSGSRKATIRIARESEGVLLEVEDEGKGISAEKLCELRGKSAGVGITGMRERVNQFGGRMNIESRDAVTRISFNFPLLNAMLSIALTLSTFGNLL